MATSKIPMTNSSDHDMGAGYLKMIDGTLFQWGAEMVSNGEWNKTVNFPLPFVNATDYQPFITWIANNSDVQNTAHITKDVQSMLIDRIRGTSTVYFSWFVIGRWK